jgi:hypothetical protein
MCDKLNEKYAGTLGEIRRKEVCFVFSYFRNWGDTTQMMTDTLNFIQQTLGLETQRNAVVSKPFNGHSLLASLEMDPNDANRIRNATITSDDKNKKLATLQHAYLQMLLAKNQEDASSSTGKTVGS